MPVDPKALAEAMREAGQRAREYEGIDEDDVWAGQLRLPLSALAEARDALEPFASVKLPENWSDRDGVHVFGNWGGHWQTVGDVRRAASLHTTLNEALKEKADG